MLTIRVHSPIVEDRPRVNRSIEWGKWPLTIDDGDPGIEFCSETGRTYYTREAANRVLGTLKEGWRLPTKYECENSWMPAIPHNTHLDELGYPPGNGPIGLYWTSSHDPGNNDVVLKVCTQNNDQKTMSITIGKKCLVWPVRDRSYSYKYGIKKEYR